jgi:hypothetical protein
MGLSCTGVKMDNSDNKLMTLFLLVGLLMLSVLSAEMLTSKIAVSGSI